MGSGPLWGNVYELQQPCRRYWWSSLLYIQNFVNVDDMVLPTPNQLIGC